MYTFASTLGRCASAAFCLACHSDNWACSGFGVAVAVILALLMLASCWMAAVFAVGASFFSHPPMRIISAIIASTAIASSNMPGFFFCTFPASLLDAFIFLRSPFPVSYSKMPGRVNPRRGVYSSFFIFFKASAQQYIFLISNSHILSSKSISFSRTGFSLISLSFPRCRASGRICISFSGSAGTQSRTPFDKFHHKKPFLAMPPFLPFLY